MPRSALCPPRAGILNPRSKSLKPLVDCSTHKEAVRCCHEREAAKRSDRRERSVGRCRPIVFRAQASEPKASEALFIVQTTRPLVSAARWAEPLVVSEARRAEPLADQREAGKGVTSEECEALSSSLCPQGDVICLHTLILSW